MFRPLTPCSSRIYLRLRGVGLCPTKAHLAKGSEGILIGERKTWHRIMCMHVQETQHTSTTYWTVYQPHDAQSKHEERNGDTTCIVFNSQWLTLITFEYTLRCMSVKYERTWLNAIMFSEGLKLGDSLCPLLCIPVHPVSLCQAKVSYLCDVLGWCDRWSGTQGYHFTGWVGTQGYHQQWNDTA